MRVVLDTSVIIAGLRTRRGVAFRLLQLIGRGRFELAVSVPLVVEYEDALLRHARTAGLTHSDCREVIDYICRVSRHQEIFFLWRPLLRDPNDDMVAELAVAANCEGIVTYNQRDFDGVQSLGLRVFTPADLLREIGELS